MTRSRPIRTKPGSPLRVMLIDSNPVFRGACRALLMTEGVDVVASCAPQNDVADVVRRLRPEVVLTEVGTGGVGEQIALLIRSLPDPPAVLLISAHDPLDLIAAVRADGSLAKADICAEAIARALRALPVRKPHLGGLDPPRVGERASPNAIRSN